MSEIKIKIYSDANSTGVDSASATIDNWLVDRKYPWSLYKFDVTVLNLGADFTDSESQTLFPEFTEYPKISITHRDNTPIDDNKFEAGELLTALNSLHTFIR